MFLEQLRKDTRQAHQSLEGLLIPYLKKVTKKEEYISLLEVFYGFYQPLEDLIARYANKEIMHGRRKAEWLLADLNILGHGNKNIYLCSYLPAIANKAEALGALYVLEGSTLGGKIISAMLQKNMGIGAEEGIGFFTGYGDDTDVKWAEFTSYLSSSFPNNDSRLAILFTANETFIKFRAWIAAKLSV